MPETNQQGSRRLLKRLRETLSGAGEGQERLDKITSLIACEMKTDVCSIYLFRDAETLELCATEGLKPESVHQTRMRLGEGLVGRVALRTTPINTANAPAERGFRYMPETGEERYSAFLGVPIQRLGERLGVLVVQSRDARAYSDDDVYGLEVVAMVLAEIVDRINPDALNNGGDEKRERNTVSLEGRVFCDGLGYGRAVLHDPVVPAAKFFAADQRTESERLSEGMKELKASIDRMMALDGATLGEDPRDVMETYRLLAHDPSWAEKLQEGVKSGLSAEASVDRARREHRARLQSARDPYLRERLHDLEDLDNRLLRILGGEEGKPQISEERSVLVARRLGPAELLEYSNTGLRAILMEEAAASSHAAIVARALGIPTLGGITGLTTRIDQGDWVIVDAEEGTLHIRPDDSLYDAYKGRVSLRSERQAAYEALKDLPARTRDGTDVSLMLNAGLDLDMDMMKQAGADGVGLFRTEFQFLVSESLPRVNDQIDLYKRVLDKAGGKPVVFRTVDLGGDKVLPALNLQREENPALGWRSIRFALDHKGLFRRQLRALIRAAGERPLTVMFPMVTVPSEFDEARALLETELEWSDRRTGRRPSRVEVGVMLETPALAYGLPELAGKAEFLSVGTNDLMQFFFAADRMTPHVSDRYDLVSPSALRFLKSVSESCEQHGIRMSACGEATGSTLSALCFVALGFTTLSMSAGSIGPVKQMIRSLDLTAFRPDFLSALETPEQDFRNQVLALAADHGVELSDG